MAVNKSSVAYMREYLKHALEFEKYVYIWSCAMNNANSRMEKICSEKRQLQNKRDNAIAQLDSFDIDLAKARELKESEARRYRKRAKIALFVGIAECFLLPICLYFRSVSKEKAEALEAEAAKLNRDSMKMHEMLLQEQEKEAEKGLAANNIEETAVNQKQEEIHKALVVARSNLAQIYSENVLPQKYRNLAAVATMYEYLETGRCTIIQGHGGIYDTYEVERIHLEQLRQMVQINKTLSRMEDNQRYICQELRQANQTLSSINSSLSEIEKTNAEIAKNTAISAAANKQTAAATSWLAWNAWANGN